jgi:lipoyl(octanoyl) transferase
MRQCFVYGCARHCRKRLLLTDTLLVPMPTTLCKLPCTSEGESVITSCTLAPQTRTTDPAFPPAIAGSLLVFPTPVPYSIAWELQSRLHHERLLDVRPDTVVILEHQPVYTLGRSTQTSDWGGDEALLRINGTALYRVNRGGSATYHGPGQIVVYPILKLAQYAAGPRVLVQLLEDVIIRLLKHWDIDGHRIEKKPGIWVLTPQPAKIASIGIRIERGITLHGFSLNVDMDLAPFQRIRPCGFADCQVSSMNLLCGKGLPLDTVKSDLARIFGEVFSMEWATVAMYPDNRITAADEFASANRFNL